jgi:predicted Zn-dependent peptidase
MIRDHSIATQLNNGLTVVTRFVPPPNGYDPVARISVHILAGTRDEVPDNHPRGAMHFLEHMLDHGSKKHPESMRDLIEGIDGFESIYGSFNMAIQLAFTNFDAVVPAGATDFTLDVIGSALSEPLFNRENIEVEKPIIQCERIENQHDFGHLENLVAGYVGYGRHPGLHPVIGSEEGIDAVTPDVLYDIHAKNYHAGRAVVAVEGPIDHHDVVASVKEHFNLPHGRRPWSEIPHYTGGYVTYPVPIEGTHLAVALKAPWATNFDDIFAFHVAQNLLCATGKEDAHSLFRALRNQGIIYKVKIAGHQMMDAGLWTAAFGTLGKPGFADRGIRTIHSVLTSLAEHVDGRSFERIRAIEERTRRHLDGCELYGANNMADSIFMHGEVTPMHARSDRRLAVTTDDVRRVVRNMVVENPPTILAACDVGQVPSREGVMEIFGRISPPPRSDLSVATTVAGTGQPIDHLVAA